ncbi:MAG: NAD(P)/FAD-dependent oxidoreductase [Armatimonadota bacterium]|nr:NAD(P)/FAD-dependent oxidoreductase [Armatimonadota bacterium]
MKRVVIIGMGFGGIRAAANLAGKGLDVLVLDRRNFHLFQPLLYQVSTATLNQEDIAYPIRALVRRWRGVRFEMAEVQSIDLEGLRVMTDVGDFPYDYLIVAAGSVSNFFGMESISRQAYDLKQLADAVALRNQILLSYERADDAPDDATRSAFMTFVIVGGGPTGVEFAGALAELVRNVFPDDYPGLRVEQTRIILIEAGDRLLAPFPESCRNYAMQRLQSMGVEVRLNTVVSGAEPDCVLLKDGSKIPAHTLFWAAGVRAAPLADAIAVPKARGGRIPVESDLSLKDHPEVFVIGDMAYLEQDGQPLPMMAPVAMQGGEHAAKMILRRERGQATQPFRYLDKGSMAVIGRYAAVAQTSRFAFKGFVAWLAWLGLHLFYLIGFRNRIATMINWAYDYLFFNRQVRLITRAKGQQGKTV